MSYNLADFFLSTAADSGIEFTESAVQEQIANQSGVLSNLSRAALLLDRPEARAYAGQALSLAEDLLDPDPKDRRLGSAISALAGVERAAGNLFTARVYMISARACFVRVGDMSAVEQIDNAINILTYELGQP